MFLPPEIIGRIENYLLMWGGSDAAKRVDAVESLAHVHGAADYEGETIPDVIYRIIIDLMWFLKENPQLLEQANFNTDDEMHTQMERYLASEQDKFDRAQAVLNEMNSYTWGALDPRFRKKKKEYDEIMNTFNRL